MVSQTMTPATMMGACLLLRLMTAACLLISLIILATNSLTILTQAADDVTLRFNDIYAYRYMLSAAVIGLAYTAVQTFFAITRIATANSQPNYLFEFYGDKVISYLMATGSAAGFGVTKDLKETILAFITFDSNKPIDKFFNKGYASASLLLIAFVCTAVLSVFSSLALSKRQTQT